MRHARLHSIVALLTLTAFCTMMAVKTFHHHAPKQHEPDRICVLDGESLYAHGGHSHASFVPHSYELEEHCSICQFQIVKVPKVTHTVWLRPMQLVRTLSDAVLIPVVSTYYFSIPSRAPPAMI